MLVKESLEREFTLRNYETNFRQELKPSALLGYFQETAGDHSEMMGLGFARLAEKGYGWLLSKIFVQFEELPKFGDTVLVRTWPHKPNKAIYERSFELLHGNGVIARAYSRWCIFNKKSGMVVPCSKVDQPEIDFIEKRSVDFNDWQLRGIEHKSSPEFSIRIANSEYDLNYHVNNIRYADYIFNCFTVRELEERRLKSFQLHYIKQSRENDVLDFYREETSASEYTVEGIKNGEELVVSARICFE